MLPPWQVEVLAESLDEVLEGQHVNLMKVVSTGRGREITVVVGDSTQ